MQICFKNGFLPQTMAFCGVGEKGLGGLVKDPSHATGAHGEDPPKDWPQKPRPDPLVSLRVETL